MPRSSSADSPWLITWAICSSEKPSSLRARMRLSAGELLDGVEAVAGEAIDLRRFEQPDLIVVAQCLHRYLADA